MPLTPALSPKGRGRKLDSPPHSAGEGENRTVPLIQGAREKTGQSPSFSGRGRKPDSPPHSAGEGENWTVPSPLWGEG
jgi:hypothetical protein